MYYLFEGKDLKLFGNIKTGDMSNGSQVFSNVLTLCKLLCNRQEILNGLFLEANIEKGYYKVTFLLLKKIGQALSGFGIC